MRAMIVSSSLLQENIYFLIKGERFPPLNGLNLLRVEILQYFLISIVLTLVMEYRSSQTQPHQAAVSLISQTER